ncbi:MAG: hypothetical protein ACLPKI_20935 [Streptosporangiaceae bacterium]
MCDAVGVRVVVIVDHEDKPIAIVNENAVMATPSQNRDRARRTNASQG